MCVWRHSGLARLGRTRRHIPNNLAFLTVLLFGLALAPPAAAQAGAGDLRARQAELFQALSADPANLELMFAYAVTSMQLEDYEAAILKTLGASSRLVATMLLLEYGVLGAIAGAVGALGAVALSWAVARYALELPWEPTPALTLGGIAVTTVLVAVVGLAASLDVLRHKPLATLRAE